MFKIASHFKGRSKSNKRKRRKHAFIIFLIVLILSTYGDLYAYPYGYYLFVSKEY